MAVSKVRATCLDGTPNAAATAEMLHALRRESPQAASDLAIALLNRGVAPQALFEACFEAAAELMMRAPGILSLHATTFTNAMGYAWRHCRDDETRKLLLLQNAAFLPLFRRGVGAGVEIDRLEPLPLTSAGSGPAAVEEMIAEVSRDRLTAARKMLTFLHANPDPRPLADTARRLIFLKGADSHDDKYSSAVLEDYASLARPPPSRSRARPTPTASWSSARAPRSAPECADAPSFVTRLDLPNPPEVDFARQPLAGDVDTVVPHVELPAPDEPSVHIRLFGNLRRAARCRQKSRHGGEIWPSQSWSWSPPRAESWQPDRDRRGARILGEYCGSSLARQPDPRLRAAQRA